jgi:bifunctional non-homologous end joining protein LigD
MDPMPERLVPMLAKAGPLPKDDGRWAHEVKWDGVRAIAYVDGGDVRLCSRSLRDITRHYPEILDPGSLAGGRAVLDGEVVALDEQARPDFQLLQRRMHVTDERSIARLRDEVPVVFVVFDLLWLDGRDHMRDRYDERREALAALELDAPCWTAPTHHVGQGEALLAASRERGLEGIVAKRLDCPYTPGRRSSGWVKVKNVKRASLVIAGWLPGEGKRRNRIGALLMGYYEDDVFRYAGRVGTGFNEAELDRLSALLAPHERPTTPFGDRRAPRGSIFVEPRFVCDVDYVEWTRERTLRAPSYKGIRDDIEPRAVVWGSTG